MATIFCTYDFIQCSFNTSFLKLGDVNLIDFPLSPENLGEAFLEQLKLCFEDLIHQIGSIRSCLSCLQSIRYLILLRVASHRNEIRWILESSDNCESVCYHFLHMST